MNSYVNLPIAQHTWNERDEAEWRISVNFPKDLFCQIKKEYPNLVRERQRFVGFGKTVALLIYPTEERNDRFGRPLVGITAAACPSDIVESESMSRAIEGILNATSPMPLELSFQLSDNLTESSMKAPKHQTKTTLLSGLLSKVQTKEFRVVYTLIAVSVAFVIVLFSVSPETRDCALHVKCVITQTETVANIVTQVVAPSQPAEKRMEKYNAVVDNWNRQVESLNLDPENAHSDKIGKLKLPKDDQKGVLDALKRFCENAGSESRLFDSEGFVRLRKRIHGNCVGMKYDFICTDTADICGANLTETIKKIADQENFAYAVSSIIGAQENCLYETVFENTAQNQSHNTCFKKE